MKIDIGRLLKRYSLKEISNMSKANILYLSNSYNGITFLGEKEGTSFITYKDLISEIGGYLRQEIRPVDIKTGGNWLEFLDTKYQLSGKARRFFVAKNPVTYDVSYGDLLEAGCVYGLDSVFKNGKVRNTSNIPINYKPKFIKIGKQTYIVRLLKGKTNFDLDEDKSLILDDYSCQNSEWNRVMLPITKAYRYGEKTYNREIYIEWGISEGDGEDFETRDYDVELAKYNWLSDLNVFDEGKGRYLGICNWCEEVVASEYGRAIRGTDDKDYGAVYSSYAHKFYNSVDVGFRPVLELVN